MDLLRWAQGNAGRSATPRPEHACAIRHHHPDVSASLQGSSMHPGRLRDRNVALSHKCLRAARTPLFARRRACSAWLDEHVMHLTADSMGARRRQALPLLWPAAQTIEPSLSRAPAPACVCPLPTNARTRAHQRMLSTAQGTTTSCGTPTPRWRRSGSQRCAPHRLIVVLAVLQQLCYA